MIKNEAKKPPEGGAWNPMSKFPRNAECFCDSGKKFKKCCLPTMAVTIPESTAKKLSQHADAIKSGRIRLLPNEGDLK